MPNSHPQLHKCPFCRTWTYDIPRHVQESHPAKAPGGLSVRFSFDEGCLPPDARRRIWERVTEQVNDTESEPETHRE